MLVLRVIWAVIGSAFVLATLASAVKTIVVPRALPTRLTRLHFLLVRRVFDLLSRRGGTFARRDRIMALYAPIALVALPVTWAVVVGAGFALVLRAAGVEPWTLALETSGSSLFTLGFLRPDGVGRQALTFVEAGIGLGLVSLMISYLPTIYAAFSRREALVGMLEVRAGLPPSPVQLLVRYQFIGWLDNIDADLFQRWEPWFADVEESHTSQPALVFFRSPHPERHWLTAAGCVLDSAALVSSTLDREPSGVPDLLVRAGYLTLRRIADFFGIPYDPDPAPTDPISISRDEFDAAYEQLRAAGVPVRDDRDQAWLDFAGWRVNYDAVLLALCGLAMVPPAMWSGDRAPTRGFRPPVLLRRGSTPTRRSSRPVAVEGEVAGVRPRRVSRRR